MGIDFKQAVRQQILPTIAFWGPTGSGKTPFALSLACGFCNNPAEEVFVIDAEDGASSMYADGQPFEFKQVVMEHHHPHNYMEALDVALRQGAKVIIIDTLSGPWEGGIGSVHDLQRQIVEEQKRNGRTPDGMAAWGAAKAPNVELLRHIRAIGNRGKATVICPVRAATEYQEVVKTKRNGQTYTAREAVGLAPVQDKNCMFEFMLKATISADHTIRFDDSRDSPLAGQEFHKPGPELATIILEWLKRDAQPVGEEKSLARIVAEMLLVRDASEEDRDRARRFTTELFKIAGMAPPAEVTGESLLIIQNQVAWLDSALRAEYQQAKFQSRLPLTPQAVQSLVRRLHLRSPKDLITEERITGVHQEESAAPRAQSSTASVAPTKGEEPPAAKPASKPQSWGAKSGSKTAPASKPAPVEAPTPATVEEAPAIEPVHNSPHTSDSVKTLVLALSGPHKGVDGPEYVKLKTGLAEILGFNPSNPKLFHQIAKSVSVQTEQVLAHLTHVVETGKEAGQLTPKKGLTSNAVGTLLEELVAIAREAIDPAAGGDTSGEAEPSWATEMRRNPLLADATLADLEEIRNQAEREEQDF